MVVPAYETRNAGTASAVLDPRARTIGLVPMLVMRIVFTPFESGLIVPAKNHLEARRLLRGAPARLFR